MNLEMYENIKICGIKTKEDINIVNKYKPKFIGFIFYKKSKRYIDYYKAKKLLENLDDNIRSVGVFVNEKIENILKCIEVSDIDIIQLHGEESQLYITELREKTDKQITKVFRVTNHKLCFEELDVDYYLFDTLTKNEYGGSGKSFNWKIISDLRPNKPFFLAGGININNINNALKTNCNFIDISSGVEIDDKKNENLIHNIFIEIKRYNNEK